MNTLQHRYETLTKVYIRLENLIRTSIFKAVRAADEWLETQKAVTHNNVHAPQPQAIKTTRWNENEYDRIAYNDAINRRFELYYKLTCDFLTLYLQEKYAITAHTPKAIVKACLAHGLITTHEHKEFLSMMQYAACIQDPYNCEGDYECSEELLVYTVTLNDILLRLNPLFEESKHFLSC